MTKRILHCSHGLLAAMFAAVALLVFTDSAFAVHPWRKSSTHSSTALTAGIQWEWLPTAWAISTA
jgi:hypothetical protein